MRKYLQDFLSKMVDLKKRLSTNISGLILILITAFAVGVIVWFVKNSEDFQSFTSYITGKMDQQKRSAKFLPQDAFAVVQISDSTGEGLIQKSLDDSLTIFDIDLSEFLSIFENNNQRDIAMSISEKDGQAEMIIAAKIYDFEKFKEIKNKLTESGIISDDMIGEFYFAESGRSLVLSTDKDLLDNSINQNFSKSIMENQYWQRAHALSSKNSEIQVTFFPNVFSDKGGYVDFLTMEIVKDKEGYLLNGNIVGNEEVMKAADIKFNQKKDKEFSLYQDIPKENLLFLFEGFDLKEEIETAMNLMKMQDEEMFNKLQDNKKHLKDAASIDFDNDIASWMNDNYLLALSKNEDGMSDLSIVFDVKTADQKAKSFFDEANKIAKIWANTAPEFSGKIKHRNISDSLFAFDLEGVMPMFRETVSLIYGVTKENLVIFSTLVDADQKIIREEHFIKIPDDLSKGQNLILLFPSNITDMLKIKDIFMKSVADEYKINLEGVLRIDSSLEE